MGRKEIEWNEWAAEDLESAIIISQKLRRVEPSFRGYTMEFDDISIRVSEWNADCLKLNRKKDHWSYHEIAGMQCYLEKRCRCCKKATHVYMDVRKAIAEWSKGSCICDLSDITIE